MAAFDTVKGAIDRVVGWFRDAHEEIVRHSIVPDMVRSVEDWFVRMKTSMLAETQEATAGVQAHFNAMSTGIINASYVTEDATENTGHWARAMEDLQMVGRQTVFSLGRGFLSLVRDGESFSDVLKGLLTQLSDMAMMWGLNAGMNGGFSSMFSGIGGLFGFANGGSFTVGGSGGTDSQTVAFRATPGEHVSVSTPEQMKRGGGDTYVIDARGADKEGLHRLETMIAQVNGSVERRAVGAVAQEALRSAGYRRALGSR